MTGPVDEITQRGVARHASAEGVVEHLGPPGWRCESCGAEAPRTSDATRALIERLEAHDAAMTGGEWFADFGKIGAGDSGIGEMDEMEDAEGMADLRNLLPEIIAALREADR